MILHVVMFLSYGKFLGQDFRSKIPRNTIQLCEPTNSNTQYLVAKLI